MKNLINTLGKIIAVLLILILVWIAISYGEIVLKNISDNPIYSDWNLFKIFVLDRI